MGTTGDGWQSLRGNSWQTRGWARSVRLREETEAAGRFVQQSILVGSLRPKPGAVAHASDPSTQEA